jgi:hypothetical protein
LSGILRRHQIDEMLENVGLAFEDEWSECVLYATGKITRILARFEVENVTFAYNPCDQGKITNYIIPVLKFQPFCNIPDIKSMQNKNKMLEMEE